MVRSTLIGSIKDARGDLHCPRRHRPSWDDFGLPNGCSVIIHLVLRVLVRVRQPRLPITDAKAQMSFRAAVRDDKYTYFDLPPTLPRPGLAVEIRPASVSSPLPPVVVVTTLPERLVNPLRHPFHISGMHVSGVPLLALGCRWGNLGFRLLLGYYVIEELEQIFEVFQLPVIFLAEALELRRILVADNRIELG